MRVGELICASIPPWRYLGFGILSFSIELMVLNILMHTSQIYEGVWYAVFRTVSYLVGHIFRFNFNKHYVFRSEESLLKEVRMYFAGICIGILIGVISSSIIVYGVLISMQVSGKIWANGAALIGDVIAGVWDWLWNRYMVFPYKNKKVSQLEKINNFKIVIQRQ
jgi:putative flippase GtrA